MRDPRLLPMKEVGWTTWGSITHKINSNNNDTMSNNSSSIINNSSSSTTNSTTHRQGTPIILPPPSRILVGRLGSVYCFPSDCRPSPCAPCPHFVLIFVQGGAFFVPWRVFCCLLPTWGDGKGKIAYKVIAPVSLSRLGPGVLDINSHPEAGAQLPVFHCRLSVGT